MLRSSYYRDARSRAVLMNNMTKDPSYLYGNSTSNLSAHWKARRDMINSTMNRNSSLIHFDNKKREQGYLDLARKIKKKKHKRKHRKALHSEIDDKVKPFSETEEFPSRNQFNSQGSSHLNRVSSRGNSEDSESAYNGHKLNSRPVLSLSKSRNSRGKRSKPLIHRNDRNELGSYGEIFSTGIDSIHGQKHNIEISKKWKKIKGGSKTNDLRLPPIPRKLRN